MTMKQKQFTTEFIFPLFVTIGLVAGGILHASSQTSMRDLIWVITLAIGSLPLLLRMAQSLLKREFGVDLIAIFAIFASIWAGQYLAGIVILLMLSGGTALETYAQARAKRELTQLLNRAPSVAHSKNANGQLTDISVEQVSIGDTLIIKPGEVVPVDAIVLHGVSNLDESVLSGESLPIEKKPGSFVFSGSVNQDQPLEVRSVKNSSESKYQIIVKLVTEAQESKSPVVRLADRYAIFFNLGTFAMALLAWFVFHDPVRVLAVFVVASPCPLILATPIAMISGISKAASRGIIIKNGTALEKLGEAKGLVFDKTGTLTLGVPEVAEIVTLGKHTQDEILHIAASIDQLSLHVFARSLVHYAQKQSIELAYPEKFEETFGQGVVASLSSETYFLGKLSFIESRGISIKQEDLLHHQEFQSQGKTAVYLASATELLGFIIFADIVRPETKLLFEDMKRHGLSRMMMLTGDKESVAKNISEQVGLTEYKAELLPEQKVEWITRLQKESGPMAMIGDGVNDAPALAAASIGIAIASHGATAASEAGDIVITVSDIGRVHDAVHIAQSAMKLAKQGIYLGMSASIILMIFAFLGHITPVYGAMLQEVMDVIVILNALRLNFETIQ